MKHEVLLSTYRLNELIQASENIVVVDCRFDLSDPDKGRGAWLTAHIPTAGYAHLDHDLSSPVGPYSGRHPLPDARSFAGFLSALGWTPGMLVVAYDDGSNAISGRLWWLMRYFGHPAALLDGGLAAWEDAGLPLESGPVRARPSGVTGLNGDNGMVVSSTQLREAVEHGRLTVLDARGPERFSGQVEPLDSRGGHIPGAMNRPLQLNLAKDGRFKKPEQLQAEFSTLLSGLDPAAIAHSCGSGVTACHNYFAMELAGLKASSLYPGSWSEWIRDPSRPIETGE
jgi:thiosulfate/3-mercaptopyruvate sulfurtransferase